MNNLLQPLKYPSSWQIKQREKHPFGIILRGNQKHPMEAYAMNSITQNHQDEELLSNEKQVLFDILIWIYGRGK